MKANEEFSKQKKCFWAFVRTISEEVGYTETGADKIKVPTLTEIADALTALKLDASSVRQRDHPTQLGRELLAYFDYRAAAIAGIKDKLLDASKAAQMFNEVKGKCTHFCHLPMNKQKGEKKTHNYLTCVITMLLEETLESLEPLRTARIPETDTSEARLNWLERAQVDELLRPKKYVDNLISEHHIRVERRGRKKVFHPGDVQRLLPHCDYDPRKLTTVIRGGRPVRTLARRVDGAPKPLTRSLYGRSKNTTTRPLSAAGLQMASTKHCWTVPNLKTYSLRDTPCATISLSTDIGRGGRTASRTFAA